MSRGLDLVMRQISNVDLAQLIDEEVRFARISAIEECAQVVENLDRKLDGRPFSIANAIRALANSPNGDER